MCARASLAADHQRAGHERCTNDRRTRSNQDGVPTDDQRGQRFHQQPAAHAPAEPVQEACNQRAHDGDVPARDRHHVRQTGCGESCADVRGDAAAYAEQDARSEGRFRFRDDGVQTGDQDPAQMCGTCRQAKCPMADDGRIECAGDRADPLAGKERAIREAIEVLRLLQSSAKEDAVAGGELDRPGDPGEDAAPNRAPACFDTLQHDLLAVLPGPGIVEDRGPNDELVFGASKGRDCARTG